ncbi:MAG: hypothetical protein UZ01_00658 [Candidatus Brocadia sinica]|nr:MAG: hypothetical protein UZ01_00658 [Candidatus Brocadia sinica]
MSAILKEDILRGKNKETSGKEKVDKIMSTIVESIETPHAAKMEKREGAVPSESIKSTETEDALKQHIFSSEILIEGESKTDLDEVRNRLLNVLKPLDEIESIIVDRIVSSVWRLKRCLRIESQIMEYESSCIQEYEQGFFRTRKRSDKELTQLKALKIIENKNRIADLSEYETILEMQLYKALRELDKYRRREARQEKRMFRRSK